MKPKGQANWASAASHWQHRPPIIPDPEDIRWFQRVAESALSAQTPHALLLGVTAGIATMAWPGFTVLTAVDWSRAMIQKAWPQSEVGHNARVVQADWRDMPLPSGSCAVVLGDGCYTALGEIQAVRDLNAAVAEVLKRGGTYALRCFSRGDQPPDVESLFDELLAGGHTNLGCFRWLLMMALQGATPDGVLLDDLWQVWHQRVPDPEAHRERFGWQPQEIENIERYAGQQVHYIYPTIAEMRDAAPDFELVDCDIPSYPYGEHFPRLTFKKI